MELWLRGSRNVRIPVLPSGYSVTSEQKNTNVDIIGLGEVTLRGKRKLREISFSSFFPYRYDSSYCDVTSLKTPQAYVKLIESMKQSGTVKLIITGTPISFRCTIESFKWDEEDGTGDIYYTLTLKEYRAPSASTSSVVIG